VASQARVQPWLTSFLHCPTPPPRSSQRDGRWGRWRGGAEPAGGGGGGGRGGGGGGGRGHGGGGGGAAATWAARLPQRRWLSQREVAAAAVAATGASTGRRRESTVTKVEHGNSSGKPAQSRQRDADIVPQAPGWGASEPAFSARDAQFFGNCHRTWWEVTSQYRDHSLSPFTEGQMPLRWLVINTFKSRRRGS